jgi:hypothetical protein
MTSAQDKAYKFRRLILVVGIVFTLAGLVWVLLPIFCGLSDSEFRSSGIIGTVLALNPVVKEGELPYAINVIIIIGIILLLQWAYLRPGKDWKIRLMTEGRPLKTSVFAASVMAMLITTGVISLLLEFPNWWEKLMDVENSNRVLILTSIYGTMFIIWGIWACIFFVYWKQGDRYTQLGKMIRGLVAGSVLEIMVAVPVHIWATRQRECYCCRGTYTTLVLAGTVLIWAFGPGIILLYMREKYRRAKLIEPETRSDKTTSETTL